MTPVRRGGHATDSAGGLITWSEAEGARGTRWREAVMRDGRLVRGLLLESSVTGRFGRLELTTPAGLLTLHPEPDETELHGNVVAADGVRHLAFPWSDEHELVVVDSPASLAITLRRLAGLVTDGQSRTLDAVRVDDDLDPRPVSWTVERISRHEWLLHDLDGSQPARVATDDDGRPVLASAGAWPLEA